MIDEAEFTKQYEAHARGVLTYLSYKFGADKAEDIAATAWMKAWINREQYKGDASFKTWVVTIALNKGYENHRRDKLRIVVPMTSTMNKVVHDSNIVERGIIAADQLAHIISRVKRRDVRMFKMRYVYQMDVEVVAGRLRVHASTVKTRMRRALIKALE